MGKTGQDDQLQYLQSESESLETNVHNRRCCSCLSVNKVVGLKCVFVLVLSVAVFLSALFWLPPFVGFADQGDLGLDSHYKGHDIVASFFLKRPASFLEDNILKLEDDILDEIAAPSIKVVILSLQPSAGLNITKVVFGVDPEVKNTKIPEAAQSLIRSTFASLVINQTPLGLTALFGDPFYFEVLKFPKGIVIIPPQSAFLLQKVQILFNFTLNFSIHQIQDNFEELTSQLKSGLHLASYENLYIKLSNVKGSTVAPPTTVLSMVLLAVGNAPSRLKQLAQTISGPHSGNLGLNNTVFGKVKQVSLSSVLQHSLNGGDGHSPSGSPSPAPLPHPHHHHHHHHHRHHHHHHHHDHDSPAVSPTPAYGKDSPPSRKRAPAPEIGAPAPKISSPAPERSYEARPPGCHNGGRSRSTRKHRNRPYMAPTISPVLSPRYAAPTTAPKAPKQHHFASSPKSHIEPPLPAPGSVSASSPLPSVQLPSKGEPNGEHSSTMPSVSPPAVSSASGPRFAIQWAFLLFLALVHLQSLST